MIDGTMKLKKYIIIGREEIIHNIGGDDRRRLITELYIKKPNTQLHDGSWREWTRIMYNEIVSQSAKKAGATCRGRDVNIDTDLTFMAFDGTAQDFIDINFNANPEIETNNIRVIKTYANKSFMSRDRTTSFHKEFNIAVDENGNGFIPVDEADHSVVADFSTIPAGSKYLYDRITTPDGECIIVTDVGYWLKHNAVNDTMSQDMYDSLDNIASNNWAEIMESTIIPDDEDFDALESALQADPEWGSDPTFNKFLAY